MRAPTTRGTYWQSFWFSTAGAVGAGAFGNDPSTLTSTLANAPSAPTMNVCAIGRLPTYSLLQRGSAPIRMMGFTGVGPMYFTWPTIVPVPPWPAIGVDVMPSVTSVAAAAAAHENIAFFMGTPLVRLRRGRRGGLRRSEWLRRLRTGLRLPRAPHLVVVVVRIVVEQLIALVAFVARDVNPLACFGQRVRIVLLRDDQRDVGGFGDFASLTIPVGPERRRNLAADAALAAGNHQQVRRFREPRCRRNHPVPVVGGLRPILVHACLIRHGRHGVPDARRGRH